MVRFLRTPQLRALETYWYLRVVSGTPHVASLYTALFPKKSELLEALGLTHPDVKDIVIELGGVDDLLAKVKTDDELVKRYKLEALRRRSRCRMPATSWPWPWARARPCSSAPSSPPSSPWPLEYPEGPFIQNALVFAPGNDHLSRLRELAESRLSPHPAAAPLQALRGLLQAHLHPRRREGPARHPRQPLQPRRHQHREDPHPEASLSASPTSGPCSRTHRLDEVRRTMANLRLQAIACSAQPRRLLRRGAPHLRPVRSDTELKRVRQTVDYLPRQDRRDLRGQHHRHALLRATAPARRGDLVRPVAGHPRRHPQGSSTAASIAYEFRRPAHRRTSWRRWCATSSGPTATSRLPNGAPGQAGDLLSADRRPARAAAGGRARP